MAESPKTLELPGGEVLCYRYVRRRGQKNVYLRIGADGVVTVSSGTAVTDAFVKAFLRDRIGWIERKLAHRKKYAKTDPDVWEEGCTLWHLGRRFRVQKVRATRNRIRRTEEGFVFECRDVEKFREALNRFRLAEAEKVLVPLVERWSRRMALVPKEVRFRRYKSLWGLCRPDDTLVFNTALLRYEEELLDYVVVHELAHIRHKNHSEAFWSLVERFVPDYKKLRMRLV